MVLRRTPPTSAPAPAAIFRIAAGCYAANCALGTSVALRLIDTKRFRWVHHALFIATAATTALAVSSAWWAVPRDRARRAAIAMAPASVPLAIIPYAGTRGRGHPLIALSAAPFFVLGAALSK